MSPRARSPRGPEPPPLYAVHVAAHGCDRYSIPELRLKIPACSVDHARRQAVAEAHRRGGLPPWRPLIRASMPYATARRAV